MLKKLYQSKTLIVTIFAAISASFLISCSTVQALPSSSELNETASSSSAISSIETSVSNIEKAQSAPESQAEVRYFFPRDGQEAKPELIRIINSAGKTLDIAIYSFTDKDICTAIEQAKKRGVVVRMITDKQQSSTKYQKALLKRLKSSGIPIKIETHEGIMHLKVTIADHKTTTTGSFNYTKSAEQENDEVFVVLNSEKIAGDFEKEFNRMWNDKKGFAAYSGS